MLQLCDCPVLPPPFPFHEPIYHQIPPRAPVASFVDVLDAQRIAGPGARYTSGESLFETQGVPGDIETAVLRLMSIFQILRRTAV